MDAQEIKARIAKNDEIISKKMVLIEKKKAKAVKIAKAINASVFMQGKAPALPAEDAESILAYYDAVDRIVREDISADECIADNKARNDIYWQNCDLYDCYDSIHNNERAIAEKQATNAKYEAQLAKLDAESDKIANLPAVMVEFRDSVAQMWDAWDGMRKASVLESKRYLDDLYKNYDAMPYDEAKREAYKAYNAEYEEVRSNYSSEEWNVLAYKSDEEIHAENMKSADKLVLNFHARVADIVDEIADASDLRLNRDNAGYIIINGKVKGSNGKTAKVQSVGAGGWNIQRFHIRVLVHEVKGVA